MLGLWGGHRYLGPDLHPLQGEEAGEQNYQYHHGHLFPAQVHVSSENLLTCCRSCGFGCNGGFPGAAWNYWLHKGLVSGGQYGSHEGCQPYQIKPCQHHVNGTRGPCEEGVRTPKCHHTCENAEFKVPYEKDKTYGRKIYSVKPIVNQIQLELMTNGPVEAAFTVFEDFPNYKSGVYQHTSGKVGGSWKLE